MSVAPVQRHMSESATDFEKRVVEHCAQLALPAADVASRDAAAVFAEGVVAGLSIALAAAQRRERVSDHLRRWESALAVRLERERRHGR